MSTNPTVKVAEQLALEGESFNVMVTFGEQVIVKTIRRGESIIVGRGSEADLVIDDPSVSRAHAHLEFDPPASVRDLDSANGTRVSGVPISSSDWTPLRIGMQVELGDAVLTLQTEAATSTLKTISAGDLRTTSTAKSKFIAEHPMSRRLLATARRLAASSAPLLIQGETGVGKKALAAQIHVSASGGPLITVNCAGLNEKTAAKELFGPGRKGIAPGYFVLAQGGTVVLDRVSSLTPTMQGQLLSLLDDGGYTYEGKRFSNTARIIATTQVSLEELVAAGEFRKDLLFRLQSLVLDVPPLRLRASDVPVLLREFLAAAAAEMDATPPTLSEDAEVALEAYAWPGNVRELQNTAHSLVLMHGGGNIDVSMLPEKFTQKTEPDPPATASDAIPNIPVGPLKDQVEAFERDRIMRALERCGGNQTQAAKLLGISRKVLIRRIECYGIPRPRKGT